jgi:hypothetical protein
MADPWACVKCGRVKDDMIRPHRNRGPVFCSDCFDKRQHEPEEPKPTLEELVQEQGMIIDELLVMYDELDDRMAALEGMMAVADKDKEAAPDGPAKRV